VVSALERSGPLVHVRMALSNDECITARITQESAELLGLVEGMTAIALCKATAVRVERADAARRRRGNQLTGTVAKVARGESGDEIVMALAGGLQLVGFAASDSSLRTRQRVTAVVDESAVVVALPGLIGAARAAYAPSVGCRNGAPVWLCIRRQSMSLSMMLKSRMPGC
jgi:molybdate transport system regulatory protein